MFIFDETIQKTMKAKNELMFALGSTLRQLRMRRGFKSAELFSYENDLNRTAYWRWENGENITMKNFLKLCSIHKISPKQVFEIIETKSYSIIQSQGLLYEPDSVLLKKKKIKKPTQKDSQSNGNDSSPKSPL